MDWVNAMSTVDFITSQEGECKQYGLMVKDGKLDGDAMSKPLQAVKEKGDLTETVAIDVIKNISLAAYYVPIERTDFQLICNETLSHAAKSITAEGSINFKILYALYKSQIEENGSAFKGTARSEIVGNMLGRFDSLVNGDKTAAEKMKSTFDTLLKKDHRFSVYSY
jgi:hypothetical protein